MNNIIKNNESIFDIALKTGSIENVFTIAEQNSISITDDLLPGTQISIAAYKQSFNSITEHVTDVTEPKQEAIVRSGQSILDIAVQESGSVEQFLPIAIANGIQSLDDTTTGLKLLHINKTNPEIVADMAKRNKPATSGNYTGNIYGEYEATEYTNQEYTI